MLSFSSNDKVKIRLDDLNLIMNLSQKANRKLTYLGLPSPWMGDVRVSNTWYTKQEKKGRNGNERYWKQWRTHASSTPRNSS